MSVTTSLSAIERINALLDDNSFVEIGGLVKARSTDFNLSAKETPGDGVVTGYGLINGCLVYVYSQDAAVLNGSVGEMHAKKIVRIYDMALKTGAPVIGLVDSAGLRLQEATDALNAFAKIYRRQAMASGVIPQVTAVFGNCGGGLSVMAGMTDFTLMSNDGHMFVNSPNVLDGNFKEKNDTSSSDVQAKDTANVDFTGTEEEVIEKIRDIISIIPANNQDDLSYEPSTDDLNREVDAEGLVNDMQEMISVISDNGNFVETKREYASDAVTGFMRLDGHTVGVVANNSNLITSAGAEKMSELIRFCDSFGIPVVSFVNATGFETTIEEEMKLQKAISKLAFAFASATVPKVSVIVGESFGSAYSVMNSKGLGADMVYAWNDTKIGMMDSEAAVKIMYDKELSASKDAVKEISKLAGEYDKLCLSTESAASRGYVDTIIDSKDTRKYLIDALEMLYTKRDYVPDKKHGTI